MAVVVLVAISGDRLAGGLAALSAAAWFDVFLTRPYRQFAISKPSDAVTTAVLLAVGVTLAVRVDVMKTRITQRSREAAELGQANQVLQQQAAMFRTMLDAAPDGVLGVDDAGIVRLANARAGHLFGYRADELIGLPVEMLIPESSRAAHLAHRAGARASPGPWRRAGGRDPEGLRKDGTRFAAAVTLAPIGLAGAPSVMASVRDMTELRRAEQSLVRLATAVHHADAAITTRDANGIVTSWNEGAERMFGYSSAEILGRPVSILLPPDRAGEAADFQRIVEEARTYHGETRRRRKDGTDIDVSSSISPAPPGPDGSVGVLAVMQDITGRKQAQAALASRTRELEAANRELGEFAYVASHDLREPLRKISSFCQLLADRYQGRLDEDADQYLTFVVNGAQRMQQLIDDVLAFSRAGRGQEKPTEVDCDTIMKRVAGDLATVIGETGAQLIVSGPLPVVRAAAVPLTQVFQNLVSNAIKFHGSDPPQVAVSAERQDACWRFAVSDNGIGIDPAYAERVFTIFQRLHTREEFPGTGIGLAICKRIVESYGGTIWFESNPGGGTTFYWTIPAGTAG